MNNLATQLPQAEPYLVQIVDLIAALHFVKAAQSREASRYYLNGVYFDKQAGQQLHLVATDGHRLHKISIGAADNTEFNMIVSSAAIKELIKYLTANKKLSMCCTLTPNGDKLVLALDAVNGAKDFATVDGNFPQYERIIPKAESEAVFTCYCARYLADAFEAFNKLGGYMVKMFKDNDYRQNPVVIKGVNDGQDYWQALIVIMPIRD